MAIIIAQCPKCGNQGKSVKEITIRSIVKADILKNFSSYSKFYFYETPTCDVVYFNKDSSIIIYKKDVKVRIGIKEIEPPSPLCYCFDWTKEKIEEEIRQNGETKAIEYISQKVKEGKCKCDITNPSGRCCLGVVRGVVKELTKTLRHET